MILAARDGDTDKVQAPIESGADVSVLVGDGLTPLTDAAKHGHSDVATCLLETGIQTELILGKLNEDRTQVVILAVIWDYF
ncbi:hypothetical protein Acr_04g0007540 [Actinidia rufa]|uniref:Ankyrin repeat family protein n=1 Tax=Actinidia rufa TaxID=165716 RepID=A0A7J0EII7_9ERIC|nr:hypothetical protein Acr_04g0007540 [Actinidia rufa]